ncbi:SigE family RNA polymerase sigma factor [Nocardioides sambongensis]|uniref:SigE family RNA polymerase sigma factor n=1 Tax=Nocardioides sambongensis TaxID=2589074 RepID=UPI00112DAE0D|nr:SigE family RNA polymerase sigma factor [Nocardioides sambongensis]
MSARRAERDAAYVEFVTSRQAHLRRIAYAICGDWHTAEDVLQTALTKVYLAWPKVQRASHPDAYVRQIIVRTNLDERRRPWRREAAVLDAVASDRREETSTTGPDHAERSALIDALQELPQMQRKVVVLRHWLDLSVAETSAELGISEGTVKSHSSRAMERLRTLLATADRE